MVEAEEFYLVKVHPKNLSVRVLKGTPDLEAFRALWDRAIRLVDCLEHDVLPEGPMFDWECKNCVYNVVCSRLKEDQKRLDDKEEG